MHSLVVRGVVLRSGEELEGALTRAAGPEAGGSDDAVVHLVIRRTAKIEWSVQGSNFELAILASDSADIVRRCLRHALLADIRK